MSLRTQLELDAALARVSEQNRELEDMRTAVRVLHEDYEKRGRHIDQLGAALADVDAQLRHARAQLRHEQSRTYELSAQLEETTHLLEDERDLSDMQADRAHRYAAQARNEAERHEETCLALVAELERITRACERAQSEADRLAGERAQR